MDHLGNRFLKLSRGVWPAARGAIRANVAEPRPLYSDWDGESGSEEEEESSSDSSDYPSRNDTSDYPSPYQTMEQIMQYGLPRLPDLEHMPQMIDEFGVPMYPYVQRPKWAIDRSKQRQF